MSHFCVVNYGDLELMPPESGFNFEFSSVQFFFGDLSTAILFGDSILAIAPGRVI